MLRLAGVRIDPRTNGLHASPHLAGGFTLKLLPDGKDAPVRMPADLAFTAPVWNADGSAFAFTSIGKASIGLWVVDTRTAQAQQVPGVALNPVLGGALRWMPDGKALLVKTVPAGRKPAPAEGPPTGPIVQDATGVGKPSSTYEARDLLRTPHDADLFEYHATAQLAVVDVRTLGVRRVGQADVLGDVQVAPGGKYLLVSRIRRPYSYTRPWGRFAHDVESEKLFEAIRGLGGVTRLIMLPFESHGYAALEVDRDGVRRVDRLVRSLRQERPAAGQGRRRPPGARQVTAEATTRRAG